MTTATAAPTLTIRHLQDSDILPKEVWLGHNHMLNPHWVWVAADGGGQPQAALITAPAHGAVILLRLWVAPDAPKHVMRQLIRTTAQECQMLGMTAWMVMLDVTKPNELRLLRTALKFKGTSQPLTGYIVVGRLETVCPKQSY